MRQAARVDANQAEIVAALRAVGAFVLDLSGLGQEGVPDLYVAFRHFSGFLEIKAPGGRLSPGQKRFIANCPAPARVVRSAEEALRAIGAL